MKKSLLNMDNVWFALGSCITEFLKRDSYLIPAKVYLSTVCQSSFSGSLFSPIFQ